MKKETTFRNSERNLKITVPGTYAEQFAKHSNEFTGSLISSSRTNNQMIINSMYAARDNVKIYDRTVVDAMAEFSTIVVRARTTWYAAQQQQFFEQ